MNENFNNQLDLLIKHLIKNIPSDFLYNYKIETFINYLNEQSNQPINYYRKRNQKLS